VKYSSEHLLPERVSCSPQRFGEENFTGYVGVGRSTGRGFSLIELLVVVTVLGILVALLFPAYKSVVAHAKQAQCLGHMRQLGGLILQYSTDNNGNLLPSLADTSSSGGTPWYSLLDSSGLLIGKPAAPGTWNNQRNSIMTCPARQDVPLWSGNSAGATLHYGMNQFPGFLNRTGKDGTVYATQYASKYGYPKIARIIQPHRTMLIGEITQTYNVQTTESDKNMYPHPELRSGMNLIFYDGHGEYFKGVLPDLGAATSIKASDWEPEQSFPFF
jgi:prepilin-type N-terminal cleavage/methylation domain-containing protein